MLNYLKKHTNFSLVLIALAVIFFAVTADLRADDWPQFRGPSANSISNEIGWNAKWPENGPNVLWRFNAGVGFSSMAVVNNCVYTMGNTDNVDTIFCLDAKTGKVIWKHSYNCPTVNSYPGPRVTPTVNQGKVYTISRMGHVFCLDAKTGKKVWAKNLLSDFAGRNPGWNFAASPVIDGDMVIIEPGGRGTSLVALDKNNGQTIWKAGDDRPSYCTPYIYDRNGKKTIATMNVYGLVLTNLASGEEIWRYPWKTKHNVNASTPTVFGDKIFISSGYGHGGALVKVNQSTPIWQHTKIRTQMHTCVLWKGKLYGFDDGSKMTCLDFETGEVHWTNSSPGIGALIIADGKLIVLSDRGELMVASATETGFNPISKAKVLDGRCWVLPVLSNGRIFCKTNEGKMVCVDVSR